MCVTFCVWCQPANRTGSVFLVHPVSQLLVLFGGTNSIPSLNYFDDVWTYDPGTRIWTMRLPTGSFASGGPLPRMWHNFVPLMLKGQPFGFLEGGEGAVVPLSALDRDLNDMWYVWLLVYFPLGSLLLIFIIVGVDVVLVLCCCHTGCLI